MAESAEPTALQRRATWVGLKTLRQRPKLVGETRHGDPVFEVRSVRLVLRDEAGHFNRLAECSKCRREVPGAPVLSSSDLDRPAHSMICKDCVRASVAARPLHPERRPSATEPQETPAPDAVGEAQEQVEAVADQRLAAMEGQLQAAMTRLAELAEGERDELSAFWLKEALRQGLADIRAEVLASSGAPVAREELQALAELVQAQQGRLVSLSAVLDETRADVQRLAQSNREVFDAQAVMETAAKASADVEALRADIEAPLGVPVRNGLAMVVQAIQELARARDDVKATVDGLVGRTGGAEARVDSLASAVGDGSGRLRDLELRMQESIDRLQASLDAGRHEPAAPVRNGPPSPEDDDPTTDAATPRELLDGLERQLQEAEGRLARLSAGPGEGARPPASG